MAVKASFVSIFIVFILLGLTNTTVLDDITVIPSSSSQQITSFNIYGDRLLMFPDFNPHLYVMNMTTLQEPQNATVILLDPDFLELSSAFIDPVLGYYYLGGGPNIYRVDLNNNYNVSMITAPTYDNKQFSSFASFVDVSRRMGYFITQDAPSKVLSFNLSLANQFNSTYLSITTPFEVASNYTYGAVYSEAEQLLFLVTTEGTLERFNMATKESTLISIPGSSRVIELDTHDNTTTYIWICVDSGSDNVGMVLIYDFDLNLKHTISYTNNANCKGITFDATRGEAFVIIGDNGNYVWPYSTLTGNYTQLDSPDVLNIDPVQGGFVVPETKLLYLLGVQVLEPDDYTSTCSNDCNGNGDCVLGVCYCTVNYTGAACDSLRCTDDCNSALGQGTCSNGDCICNANYTGATCAIRQCPYGCSTHGTCSGAPDYECTCTGAWTGYGCATAVTVVVPPTPCNNLTTYKSCLSLDYCGWCGDYRSGFCEYGDLTGPVHHACVAWWYNQEPEIGVPVLAIIFLCILGFLFLIDFYSAMRIDFARAKDLREEYQSGKARKPTVSEAAALWWRDQRSAKAYSFLEQFQLMTFFQHLALTYPSRILQFTRFLDWSNLGIPIPFLADETEHPERRKLLGMVQYANGLDLETKNIYADNMFWFGIGIGGICLVYGLLILILYKKIHWRVVLTCRLTYVLVRFINVAYFGLMVTSTYTMVAPPHNYKTIVPAAFTFVIIGLGWPIAVFFLVNGRTKQLLLDNEFRFKFGALYISYKPEKKLFYLRNLARKFFTACFIGFLAFDPENKPKYVVLIQAILIIIVQILYAIELFRSKPYYDHFHEYLEYFLMIVNVATVALSMLHYNKPLIAGELIVGLVQALGFVVCAGTYIVSWLQMSPFNLKKIFCCLQPKDSKNIPMEGVALSAN